MLIYQKWYPNKVKQILQNEKYVGDARLGKYTTTNIFQNTVKLNDGIVESYYVKNGHPAIVPRKDFEKVQKVIILEEMRRQRKHNNF